LNKLKESNNKNNVRVVFDEEDSVDFTAFVQKVLDYRKEKLLKQNLKENNKK
jgi:hypothetical protein